MPYDDFLSDLNAAFISMHRIDQLKERYIASIDATVRRALDMTSHTFGRCCQIQCSLGFHCIHGIWPFNDVAG